jgi:hypothetical protein
MTLKITTDREIGVRSLSPSFRPSSSASALAAEARERNRAHLASIEEARSGGTTNVRTAEPLWIPPPLAKMVVGDEATLREALAARLAELAEAREAERVITSRISTAVREKGISEARHAAAVTLTTSARDAAAQAMKEWLATSDGDRPTAEAVSSAVAVEAAALADVQVISAARDALRLDHEHAIGHTAKVQQAAGLVRDQIVGAIASALGAELVEVDERALELRRTLSEMFRALPMNTVVPAGVREALAPKHVPWESISPIPTPGEARWTKLRTELMQDASASLAALGD